MMKQGTPSKRGHLLMGFPRSGTTLLARLLDGHNDVSCPPETYLFRSAARFLHEQDRVEGPPIGVMSGLNFSGFSDEEIVSPLRQMLFDFHEKIAGEKSAWVEKTAVDIFHIETLEQFLGGHLRFIFIERNPLDVIASNLRLANVLGAQLHELFEFTRRYNSLHEGLAHAWADRATALRTFSKRHPDMVYWVRYETLAHAPEKTLKQLFEFLGVSSQMDFKSFIHNVFSSKRKVGLGDFNFDNTTEIRAPRENVWRGDIPPTALTRIIPILHEHMEVAGYRVPRVSRTPAREDRVRQLQLAAALKQDSSQRERTR